MIDVVVVRVLFLEPGNKVSVSDVDNGICQIGGDYYTGEDMFEHGFIKVDQMELASTISLEGQLAVLGNPSDPVCEVLKPFHILYFDLHGMARGWEPGPLAWEVESTSVLDVFSEHFDALTHHANAIRHTFKSDPHGYDDPAVGTLELTDRLITIVRMTPGAHVAPDARPLPQD